MIFQWLVDLVEGEGDVTHFFCIIINEEALESRLRNGFSIDQNLRKILRHLNGGRVPEIGEGVVDKGSKSTWSSCAIKIIGKELCGAVIIPCD
jgi:hypothetical protein